jgi:hypothetical protein
MYHLTIKDFQRIKTANMELKGFVVIEGQSNLGKSSVRRALGTVTQNIWDKSFVSHSAKNTVITLEADDIKVTAKKGTSNEFHILKGGKTSDYMKAGKDIPKELVASGFSPLTIGKDNINLLLAKQYDPLFMVSYSDQQNTKILNAVFDVDVLEKANELVIKDIASQKRELKRELQFSEDKANELDGVKLMLEKMTYLRDVYDKIDLIDSYTSCSEDHKDMSSSLNELQIKISKIDKLIELQESYVRATELQKKLKAYNELDIKNKGLISKLSSIKVHKKIKTLSSYVSKVNRYNILATDIQDIDDELSDCKLASSLYNKLKLVIAYKKKHYEVSIATDRVKQIKTKFRLIDIQSSLLLIEKRAFVIWQIEDKRDKLLAVSKSISSCDEEISLIGLCPCCRSKLHK